MMVNWLLLLNIFLVSWYLSETCKLSMTSWGMPWTVTVRTADKQEIICIGLILNDKGVVLPLPCLSKSATGEYYKPEELVVVAGASLAGKSGSCIQKRIGRKFVFLDIKDFLTNTVFMEVEPFEFAPTNEPAIHLPPCEHSIEKEWKNLKQGAKCDAPIFTKKIDNANNEVSIENITFSPIINCSRFRPNARWSSETFKCFHFVNNGTKCHKFNVGAPLTCNGTILGIFRDCGGDSTMLVQQLTDETLVVAAENFSGSLEAGSSIVVHDFWWILSILQILICFYCYNRS